MTSWNQKFWVFSHELLFPELELNWTKSPLLTFKFNCPQVTVIEQDLSSFLVQGAFIWPFLRPAVFSLFCPLHFIYFKPTHAVTGRRSNLRRVSCASDVSASLCFSVFSLWNVRSISEHVVPSLHSSSLHLPLICCCNKTHRHTNLRGT